MGDKLFSLGVFLFLAPVLFIFITFALQCFIAALLVLFSKDGIRFTRYLFSLLISYIIVFLFFFLIIRPSMRELPDLFVGGIAGLNPIMNLGVCFLLHKLKLFGIKINSVKKRKFIGVLLILIGFIFIACQTLFKVGLVYMSKKP